MKKKQKFLAKEKAKLKIVVLHDKSIRLTISSKEYRNQVMDCSNVDELIGSILGFMGINELLLPDL